MEDLKTDVENMILRADRVLLDFQNIISFQQRAREVGARKVLETCNSFVTANKRMLENAHPELDFKELLRGEE
jgi:hypothetical protein